MREEVDEMKAGRPHAMDEAVQAKRESSERSEGLVRLWIRETLAPEVILEDIREGSVAPVCVCVCVRVCAGVCTYMHIWTLVDLTTITRTP